MNALVIEDYLARIRYVGDRTPCYDVLCQLHRAHCGSVPFETFDLFCGTPLSLESSTLLNKIVIRHRGGICYELNGAFATLLSALGFNVAYLSARVWHKAHKCFGHPFEHMLLTVQLDDIWLVDVGFGVEGITRPVRNTPGQIHSDAAGEFRVRTRSRGEIDLERINDDITTPIYRINVSPVDPMQFASAAKWAQVSPSSPFTSYPICTLRTADGWERLLDHRLIIATSESRTEHFIDSTEIHLVLREKFGIELSVPPTNSPVFDLSMEAPPRSASQRCNDVLDRLREGVVATLIAATDGSVSPIAKAWVQWNGHEDQLQLAYVITEGGAMPPTRLSITIDGSDDTIVLEGSVQPPGDSGFILVERVLAWRGHNERECPEIMRGGKWIAESHI
jgi:N-hydroxyarylamine O-acetyltransferase